ncbi:zinc-dependent alcohol dehydrogenase family protein [Shinella lacus]|uniref:Zinc-dependent alcohol dehydrogenase family protein n=1 Tax=Shinella lacus TaxID=2654216 RepID=A0ABT1R5L4_9HYPH|nr:zinc-dependent alcohol dehydrogenase family protein [Shinella lacus]MCQ4630468.1 zinc-dependent alcohol dehydrogenase family protein [Shinella lacus]
MARAIVFHRHGGPEVLQIEEIDIPGPGLGEVRIRVKALGLNRAETLIRAGTYIETPTLPARLGLEASGVVDAVGAGVDGFSSGDAVSVIPPISMTTYPTHGEFAVLPANHVVKNPANLGWTEAAAVWMPYLTAYGALVDLAQLQPGEPVVITAASSSVGIAAIQIARKIGAVPVALTRTSAKRQGLLDAGAEYVIATTEEPLSQRLRQITGCENIRVVLDAVGGPMVGALSDAMSKGGILIEYGGLDPQPTPFPLLAALSKTLTLRGYLVHELIRDPNRLEHAKAFIVDGLASSTLVPTIARTFAFDDIVEAYRYLESNSQFGKVVVTL